MLFNFALFVLDYVRGGVRQMLDSCVIGHAYLHSQQYVE